MPVLKERKASFILLMCFIFKTDHEFAKFILIRTRTRTRTQMQTFIHEKNACMPRVNTLYADCQIIYFR